MLKKCYRLFLGLLVVTGSACVTPTHASSASIIITNVRAGSQVSASEEGVVLYNNSSFEADVTNWCVTNKSAIKFACFTPVSQHELSIIPAYSYATIVSARAVHDVNQTNYSIVYEPSSVSSGSVVASADTISLIDGSDQLVDQFGWTSSISSSQQWVRTKLSLLPDLFIDTDNLIDWQKVGFTEFPVGQLQHRDSSSDTPSEDPTDEPPEEPADEPTDNQDPVTQPEQSLPAVLTELLPNAIGSDTGNEFIEIYNPNATADISLKGYRLSVGLALEKNIVLDEYILKAGEYKVFTNAELAYSLLNSSSRVSLFMPNGDIASDAPAYNSPPDGQSWALIEEVWQYTNQPTPRATNLRSLLEVEGQGEVVASSTLKPCAANQYRSPETNRCRLLSSSASSSPTPCKVGQERNPDTNRCRNIKQLSVANYGVKGATTKQQGGLGWYMWAVIGGIVLLIVGYGVWEWREELKKLFRAAKAKFAGKQN